MRPIILTLTTLALSACMYDGSAPRAPDPPAPSVTRPIPYHWNVCREPRCERVYVY